MKITKQGIPPGDKIWKGRCHTCNSEAEATGKEMTNIQSGDQREGPYSKETCPVCKMHTMYFYQVRNAW